MDLVRKIIKEKYNGKDTQFVFPSEIVAAFWRIETLRITQMESIIPSCFVSWDRFKEDSFDLFRKQKPINTAIRTVFAYTLLEENKESGLELSGLIAPEFADNSQAFLGYIVRILPSLGLLSEITTVPPNIDPEFIGSLRRLLHRYKEFLLRHELFEPGFERADLSDINKNVIIFFPELIEDFGENAADLEAHPRITTVPISHEPSAAEIFRYFTNSIHEFDWVFNRIIELLTKGISPYDIAVTICDDQALIYFQNSAETYPLSFVYRGGKRVTDYPSGKFFQNIRECIDSHFHIDALKKLVLSGALPWKNRSLLEGIILTGINSLYVMEETGNGRDVRRFQRALEADGNAEAVTLFLDLHRSLRNVVESKDCRQLQQALITFSTAFFDQNNWDDTNGRVFEYALNLLTEIESSLNTIQLPPGLTPFKLFLQLLQNNVYVPKTRKQGIPVYPYRVAAGIAPKYHFIVTAHHRAAKITSKQWNFLRTDHKASLHITDKDMSSDFLRAYSLSGDNAVISCSAESFSEQTLIPAYFMEQVPHKPDEESVPAEVNPFRADRIFWGTPLQRKSINSLPALFPLQHKGIEAMGGRILNPLQNSYTQNPITDTILKAEISRRLYKDGLPAISSTRLGSFTACPFSFLLDLVIGDSGQSYQVCYSDPSIAGRFLHEVLRDLFTGIKNDTGIVAADKLDEYRRLLDETIDAVTRKFYGRGYTFLSPVQMELKGKAAVWISELFNLEQKYFPELPIIETEKEITAELHGDENKPVCMIRGIIDRLSGTKDSALLIDYKTKNRVTKADLIGDEKNPPLSFQLPMYILLAERKGYKVLRCGYISLLESKYTAVLKTDEDTKGWIVREEMDGCIQVMEGYIQEMITHIEKGYYPVPKNECRPCRYRGVCREKYNLE